MGPEQRREAGGGNTQREGVKVEAEVEVVVVGVGRRILQANTHAAVWAG